MKPTTIPPTPTSTPTQEKPLTSLLFLVAAGVLLASILFVYQVGMLRIRADQKMASHLLVLQDLSDLLSLLKDTETGQRGYLLTGDETYLQPYNTARPKIQELLAGLNSLASSGQLSKPQLERVITFTHDKLAELEQTIALRREKGLDEALAVVRENRGKQLMDDIRTEVGYMHSLEEAEFAASRRAVARSTGMRITAFTVAALVNLLFLAWAFNKISREMDQRAAATREIIHQRQFLATTLASIGDAVIATDEKGNASFLNPEAERLTGWKLSEAIGRPLPSFFRIVNEFTRQPAENPVDKVITSGRVVGLANHTILIARDGTETPIDDSAAPIREPYGPLFGIVLVFRDVSEQRKAQQAGAHLAAIVHNSGDAIITKNLNGIIQTWNESAERLFGYKAHEIIGTPVIRIIPPDRLDEEKQILAHIRQGLPFERLETVRVAKDGRRIPVSLRISPLKNAAGEVFGASKIIHDITEAVAAREALARQKELLATTLACIGDGVIVTDPQGRVTFLNSEAERLTAWNISDAKGHPLPEVFRIVNEDSREPVENPVDKVLRLGKVVGLANHTLLLPKTGSEIPIDDSAAPIRKPNGDLHGVALVFRDFTQHKLREKRLTEQSRLLDLTTDAILVRDAHDRITYWNRGATETYGYSPDEALGKVTHELLQTRFPEPLAQISQTLHTCGRWSGELVHIRRNGRSITVSSRWVLERDPKGRPLRVLETNMDITKRKQAENALQEAHSQLADRAVHLEALVRDRTSKLREMADELQHVSYAIVHDMRAPLRAMSAFSEAVLDHLSTAPRTPPHLLDYCQRIVTAAARLDKLIRDSLSYTKAVLQEVPLKPVDLATLVPGLLATYPNLQPDKADISIESPLPVVVGDESLLTQCFSNLLGNAVKFVAPGIRPQIRIRSTTADTTARISVEDNGIGIDPKARHRIFDMFQRLTADYEGTGVGLAIVRKVVERMGGKVGVDSLPGKGSCFWVDLHLANVATLSATRNPVPST